MNSAPRSLLYVPATSTRLLARAGQRGADAIVLDLEDAIAPQEKLAARESLSSTIGKLGALVPIWVRVNSQDELILADIDAAVAAGCDGIVVPKVESGQHVLRVTERVKQVMAPDKAAKPMAVQAIIESPKGVLGLSEIVSASPQLTSLAFGSEDFSTALGTSPTTEAMRLPAQLVAIAAASAGLHAMGLAGSIAGYDDVIDFERIARFSRELGMHGAACIHPAQLPILHRVFGATAVERQDAHEVLAAYGKAVADGLGAVALNGRMIDAPVAERARALLKRTGDLT